MSAETSDDPKDARASSESKTKSEKAKSPRRSSSKKKGSITGPLTQEQQTQLEQAKRELTGFIPIPEIMEDEDGNTLPYWRIRLDIDADPPESLGFDLYGPLTFGRIAPGERNTEGVDFIDLAPFDAGNRGVSRKHVELRPTPHGLFCIDLDSTNGTYKNGVPLKPNSPTPIGNRDTLSLGLLHLTVDIIDAPHQEGEWFARQATLGQAMAEMAKTITTQLKVEDVLNTVVDYALGLTDAQEATLWLLEANMRQMRLEAAHGLEPELVKNATLPLTGSIAGDAVLTGKPQVRVRDEVGKKVIITEDYLVDSVVFVPIALGGLSLGVLSVANRTPGHEFTDRDRTLLVALADFAAIALQNSRTLEATDQALRDSLRAQREATTKALEGTRLKTEFLQTVSHELRSPLHAINGFSQLLLRSELDSNQLDWVERIQKSGKQLLGMVDELLDSLRIESQELELVNEEFPPRDLVGDVVASQMPVAKERGLILSWSAKPDVPDTLVGDPDRIRQVLINLLSNALKFTEKGGVSVQLRTLGTFMWSMSVADTGKGINPENHDIIFERFRQEDQSSTRKHGGVGLGLAICRDLVNLMGGDLRVTSEGIPGKGSIFTMTMPIVRPGQQLNIVGEDETLTFGPQTRKIAAKPAAPSSNDDDETKPEDASTD